MPAPGTDSPLSSSPHSRTAFGRMLGRGNAFATAAVHAGFLRQSPHGDHRDLRRALPAAGTRCTHLLRHARGRGGATIEPATDLGSGGALRLPRARVVPLPAPPASYTAAVGRCLTGAGIMKPFARIYRSRRRRGDGCSPANRSRPDPPAGARSPRLPRRRDRRPRQGWIEGDPTIGIERRPAPPDRTNASLGSRPSPCSASTSLCGRRRSGRCSTSPPHGPTRCCASTWKTSARRTSGAGSPPRAGRRSGFTGSPAPPSSCPDSSPAVPSPLFPTDRKAPPGAPAPDACPETGGPALLPPR